MTKVLLVEDDKSLREIYGVRLLAEGYDIVSAGDGEEALAMAIKDRPGLIVSDVMMPKISGFDMLDILRSTTETKDIKVIMMTALSSEEQRQRGVALGADRYLVKSQVGIEDVIRTVHEVLGDAPVVAPTQFAAPRPAAPAPAAPAQPITVTAPTPVAMPQPTPFVAPPAPAPVAAPAPTFNPLPPAQPAPVTAQPPVQIPVTQQPAPQAPTAPVLPQPSAPFSTPRNNLASRVIEPLSPGASTPPDFTNLMSQELAGPPAPVSIPVSQPTPVAQPIAPTTPPAMPQPAPQAPIAPPLTPPELPQPPTPPNPGV